MKMILLTIIKTLILILPVLIAVAFMTLAERKVLSISGGRQGPNKVFIQGILQPIADALKLMNKSCNSLSNFSMLMYYMSVLIMMAMAITLWTNQPFLNSILNWKFSFLTLMLILGISTMKSILAGWSTYSKYSLIGSMRTTSQMISYESVIYLCLMMIIWITKNFSIKENMNQEMVMMVFMIPICFYIWLPAILGELNRTPYDFSEGESELVSGFNTEFGSKSFTLIFLSEYSNIIFFTTLTTMLFIYQNLMLMNFMMFMFFNFWIIWIRATLPRMRFDKFMSKAWKFFIPFMTMLLCLVLMKI